MAYERRVLSRLDIAPIWRTDDANEIPLTFKVVKVNIHQRKDVRAKNWQPDPDVRQGVWVGETREEILESVTSRELRTLVGDIVSWLAYRGED